mgnify:FL=1
MLFSLFLLSPVAFFLGIDYQKKQQAKKKMEDMKQEAQEIEADIKGVLRDTKQILNKRTAKRLSEALAEEISDKQ